jgi:hypothetical protein
MSRKRSSDTAVVPSKPPSRLRVRLKRFHGVAKWTWNANDDVCGICHSAFEGVAPGVKYPGDECPVVWGKCGTFDSIFVVSAKTVTSVSCQNHLLTRHFQDMRFICNVCPPGSIAVAIRVLFVAANGNLEAIKRNESINAISASMGDILSNLKSHSPFWLKRNRKACLIRRSEWQFGGNQAQ